MAEFDLSKVMSLADGQVMYKDLRDRYDPKYEKPATGIPATDLAAGVIPTVPVIDVQTNGTSILNNGVANIPVGNYNTYGVFKSGYGLLVNMGALEIQSAGDSNIKSGDDDYYPIVPYRQHKAIYYGLSKLAGADLKNATVTVGTYPDSSKQAIQKLFGLDGIFGDYQNGITASKAYVVGDTFIMDGKRYRVTAAISDDGLITVGTNCELDPLDGRYIRNTDYAGSEKHGVVKVDGLGLSVNQSNGELYIYKAQDNHIKAGKTSYFPIVPETQHKSIFYGLSKLAGVDLANETVTVGTYPAEAKAAIQSMLGVSTGAILIENVSGATPTLTCLPNVRYKCGEVSTISITPPASGSCEVIFESGSTATLLTVPNTVKFPPWFDATALETGMIYDIIITDGVYGAVMSWAS